MNNLQLTDRAAASVNNYRLNQIDKVKYYFNNELNERKDLIKKLNECIFNFHYLDKIFIT